MKPNWERRVENDKKVKTFLDRKRLEQQKRDLIVRMYKRNPVSDDFIYDLNKSFGLDLEKMGDTPYIDEFYKRMRENKTFIKFFQENDLEKEDIEFNWTEINCWEQDQGQLDLMVYRKTKPKIINAYRKGT